MTHVSKDSEKPTHGEIQPWRCLSVQLPWSYLICSGVKDIENRTWTTDYRGRVHIHSSGKNPWSAEQMIAEARRNRWTLPDALSSRLTRAACASEKAPVFLTHAIIGYVDLVDIITDSDSCWAEPGQNHWVLSNPVLLETPLTDIPGKLNFWFFDSGKHAEFFLKDAPHISVQEDPQRFIPRSERPFTMTDYHAALYAWDLSRRSGDDGFEKIAGSMMGAKVDLNPHQIDAALFALQSPLSRGVLLADEVGLGKTIEAGIVLAQKWAERKRRILLILPASLRKQWATELSEKFYLPTIILESKTYREAEKEGFRNPFTRNGAIIITSYQFAAGKAGEIQAAGWDLVVLDEAHRVRNVYRKGSKLAASIKKAILPYRKMLLTATPLQNSMMELFGLLGIIDDFSFGNEESFRAQYLRLAEDGRFEELKRRIAPYCKRTLRRQVAEYINYTKRICLTERFKPEAEEESLYTDISSWLQRPELHALPRGQRQLITLILRKLLASSTFAIAGAFDVLLTRLLEKRADWDALSLDFEELDELSDEWDEDCEDIPDDAAKKSLEREIEELTRFRDRARSITRNAKGLKLLSALRNGFAELSRFGAPEKAIIFTESKRTQSYLVSILEDSPYRGEVVIFNGTNSDPDAKRIYREWKERNKGSDRISGSLTADSRAALVDYFRENAKIMIATEAAAEGMNLQFCPLIVNYDLPWNPQRIEQRIGRCHRYGQKFDVVVVNFLNTKNQADERVYELLREKFRLFEGVFGTSDEVIGTVASGLDFEKRILAIYQNCRTSDEIKAAFDALQKEFEHRIDETLLRTKQQLLENFDEEVHSRLKLREKEALLFSTLLERKLYHLTRHQIPDEAHWNDQSLSFRLKKPIAPDIPEGLYCYREPEGKAAHIFRLQHPLAERVIRSAKERTLPASLITFFYTGYPKISVLEPLIGCSGWLRLEVITTEALDQSEDLLVLSGCTDDGTELDREILEKLFLLGGTSEPVSGPVPAVLDSLSDIAKDAALKRVNERNNDYFKEEITKLELWADDLKATLEMEIKDLDRQIREVRKTSHTAITLEEKLAAQKDIKALEAERNTKRKRLFDAQDEIDAKQASLIEEIEAKISLKSEVREVFTIKWRIFNECCNY